MIRAFASFSAWLVKHTGKTLGLFVIYVLIGLGVLNIVAALLPPW